MAEMKLFAGRRSEMMKLLFAEEIEERFEEIKKSGGLRLVREEGHER
jgi:hypothetical protein